MKKRILEAAKKIKLIALDVDGVMTDGRIIFSSDGLETKSFNSQDGHGLRMAQRAGYKIALITGRESPVVVQRARELGIEIVCQNIKDKLPTFLEVLRALQLDPQEALFIGDDFPDLPPMRAAGLSAAPVNAIDEVKEVASIVTVREGGHGAVREVIDWLLKASGNWETVTSRYYATQR